MLLEVMMNESNSERHVESGTIPVLTLWPGVLHQCDGQTRIRSGFRLSVWLRWQRPTVTEVDYDDSG